MPFVVLLLLPLAALNAVAYLHARSMTRFTLTGRRTPKAELLTRRQRLRVLLTGVTVPRPAVGWRPEDFAPSTTVLRCPTSNNGTLEAYATPARAVSPDDPALHSQSLPWDLQPLAPPTTRYPIPDTRPPRGTVLLFHGYAAHKGMLGHEARCFSALGWDALAVDFRGSGGSSGRTTAIGWREAEDVAAAVAGLLTPDQRARPVVLYGVSMGAAAVLRAVGRLGVRVDAVILECPFSTLLSTIAHRIRLMGLPAFPVAHLLAFWGGVRFGYWAFAHRPADFARGVRCPALVTAGERDPYAPPADTRAVFDNLASPNKRYLAFDAGHVMYRSVDPDRWLAAVAELLGAARPS